MLWISEWYMTDILGGGISLTDAPQRGATGVLFAGFEVPVETSCI